MLPPPLDLNPHAPRKGVGGFLRIAGGLVGLDGLTCDRTPATGQVAVQGRDPDAEVLGDARGGDLGIAHHGAGGGDLVSGKPARTTAGAAARPRRPNLGQSSIGT
jgi:hypothetical protein